jgi:hypothetical protein
MMPDAALTPILVGVSDSVLVEGSPRHHFAFRWSVVAPTAAVSLATMPITAIWFVLLAPIVGFFGAGAAMVARLPSTKDHTVTTAASLSFGLLAGPLVYLGLAVAF